ncbi:AHH domain-containing protein [Hahella sp. KA22]|uniref:AHH domain-containing protein n=1 Tax=Hahella sp. KA22 TaxID=1628392 RepID=UPI00351A4631
MRRAGEPRPSSRCDCHAIVSGAHAEAILVRGVLAWLGMRIDDPHNGCWLPRDWEDRQHMPNHLRNAVPHCRIHHGRYYDWLNQVINADMITSIDELIQALRMVRVMLESGNVPPNIMPRTGR